MWWDIYYDFVANLPLSLPVKEFWKSVNIWGSYEQEFSVLFFDSQSSYLEACFGSALLLPCKPWYAILQNDQRATSSNEGVVVLRQFDV